MKSITKIIVLVITVGCLSNCSPPSNKSAVKTDENGVAILSDSVIENIVRRSYQYVALYNVNNKWALGPRDGLGTGGWNNEGTRRTELLDHTTQSIARPNNDVLYGLWMLDLQEDAYVLQFPAFDSKYVSLMATAYDHYVNIPLSTTKGDFGEATTVLFYTERTKGYDGKAIEGIDEVFEMSGDFVSLAFRAMPHAAEPERYARIVDQMQSIQLMSLSKFRGRDETPPAATNFPEYGATDLDIFENNLLEVMQFVFNHSTFEDDDEMDQAVLAAYKPLGIEPGKNFDANGIKIDGKMFREIADKVRLESLGMMTAEAAERLGDKMFQPKGETNLETITILSVVGPIGQPMEEAMYPPVNTADGSVMNAQNDYVIRMTKEELPPTNGFWSITLYDQENGFFIPNDSKKYSVGENSGMKLNEAGGIEIYVAAEKPDGVPDENWLPINRMDQNIDLGLRMYAPDLSKVKSWKPPVADKIE